MQIFFSICEGKVNFSPADWSLQERVELVPPHQYRVQCTVHILHYTVYIVRCTVESLQCTFYSICCTVQFVHYTVYSIQCAVPSVQYTVYIALKPLDCLTQTVDYSLFPSLKFAILPAHTYNWTLHTAYCTLPKVTVYLACQIHSNSILSNFLVTRLM